MKLTGKNIVALLVLGFVIKACGTDDTPTSQSAAVPASRQAQATLTSTQQPTPESIRSENISLIKTRFIGPTSLNIRATPNGRVIGSLSHGQAVSIYAEQNDWSRISSDGQESRWVSSSHLCDRSDCSDIPRWKPTPTPPVSSPAPIRFSQPSTTTYGCPCSSGRNCTGPRGGRYCITSGGNKRYR